MELKYGKPSPFLISKAFQSYLYGIEILAAVVAVGTIALFQSYLYGIEIEYKSENQEFSSMFQSYLYGIEIIIEVSAGRCYHVSIVPLWN